MTKIILFDNFTEVLHQAKHLSGSPFTCDSYDPSKVILQGVPKGVLPPHSPVSFIGKY